MGRRLEIVGPYRTACTILGCVRQYICRLVRSRILQRTFPVRTEYAPGQYKAITYCSSMLGDVARDQDETDLRVVHVWYGILLHCTVLSQYARNTAHGRYKGYAA